MMLQGSLLDFDQPTAYADLGEIRRTELRDGAWVDHLPAWMSGSDGLFDDLLRDVPWRADKRQMYDRVLDVPRLTRFYGEDEPLPHPLLTVARDMLSAHYLPELGEDFATAGLCLYRSGSDSVAWHGDRNGRSSTHDTMVAILSLGTPRVLALRPRGGGPTEHKFSLGHGDLVVMGGSCQRTWEHCVPKTTAVVGPRISVQFRTVGVR